MAAPRGRQAPVSLLLLLTLLMLLLKYSSATAANTRCTAKEEASHREIGDELEAIEGNFGGPCQNYSVNARFLRLREIHDYLHCLERSYPQLVKVRSLGRSSQGRSLKYIHITHRTNCRRHVRKPAIFIDAGIHAREWIGPAVALNSIFQLVENFNANSDLLAAVQWFIIPVANPDGYEHTFTNNRFWRKTLSAYGASPCIGVDMNRNFRFHWEDGNSDPCSRQFRGPSPESEPEAAALARFLRRRRNNIRLYLSLHSYGPMLLTPWGYTRNVPDDDEDVMKLGELALKALEEVRGTQYRLGSSANILYPSYGSSRDYAKYLGIKYTYTMELPPGGQKKFDPPPDDISPVAAETFQAIRVFAKFLSGSRSGVGENGTS